MNQLELNEHMTMINQRDVYNVIKSLREYNRSQTKKNFRIESDTVLDHDVDGASFDSDLPQLSEIGIVKTLKKFPIYYEWVQTLIDYNDELIEIIDKIHAKTTKTKATATHSTSLIDFDVSECEKVQSTTSTNRPFSAPNTMNYEEILKQNQKLLDENAAQKRKIKNLERQNEGLEEAAVEARVLVFEVADRHDMIVKLKNEINDMEQQLKQKDTHIQFKDEIIKELRQQRKNTLRCPNHLEKTKLDSIDKVVDLIRTVRDISPESSSKNCDCHNDFYQEKENQTDDELCESIDIGHEYARKIESQQAQIELLNAEIDKKQVNYDKIAKAYASLQQQLESVKSINVNSNNVADFQVGKPVSSSVDGATAEEFPTAIADKTHLANLITTLKSELASANALLKIKEKDYNEAKEQLKRLKGDNSERVAILEKQCENYRLTIKHLEEHLQTHSDTIKRLEENQSVLKSQMAESQDKHQNIQKLMDENRKLESNHKHQLTTISFLRTALEDHLKAEKNSKVLMRSTKIGRKNTAQTSNSGQMANNIQNTTGSTNATSSVRSTSSLKLSWFK